MIKGFALLIIFCGNSFFALSQAGNPACSLSMTPWPASLQTGLVAYYPFNGNTNDQSGNGNDPTTNSATLTTDRYGNPNAAYHFDRTQYIMGDCSKFPSTTRTVSFWYRANDFTLNNDVFGYGGSICGNFDTFAGNPFPLYNYWHNVIVSYDGTIHKCVCGWLPDNICIPGYYYCHRCSC